MTSVDERPVAEGGGGWPPARCSPPSAAASSTRHGLWDDAAVRGRRPAAPGDRRARPRAGPVLVRRPARRAARQDADPGRGARRAARRVHRAVSSLLLKDTSGRSVFPVFSPGGGIGVPGLRGRGRHRARARPDDVPGAAVGRAHRLGAVRPALPGRHAGAVLHPRDLLRAQLDRLAARRVRPDRRGRAGVPRVPRRTDRRARAQRRARTAAARGGARPARRRRPGAAAAA